MDVSMILQLTWPARPEQTLLEATSRWHRKALEAVLFTWEKKRSIVYTDLIEFAKDPRFPSVTFTPLAQEGLVKLLSAGAGKPTVEKLVRRADRALSLNDPYTWTEYIYIMDDGKARLYGWPGLSHANALRRIRKEYLK